MDSDENFRSMSLKLDEMKTSECDEINLKFALCRKTFKTVEGNFCTYLSSLAKPVATGKY